MGESLGTIRGAEGRPQRFREIGLGRPRSAEADQSARPRLAVAWRGCSRKTRSYPAMARLRSPAAASKRSRSAGRAPANTPPSSEAMVAFVGEAGVRVVSEPMEHVSQLELDPGRLDARRILRDSHELGQRDFDPVALGRPVQLGPVEAAHERIGPEGQRRGVRGSGPGPRRRPGRTHSRAAKRYQNASGRRAVARSSQARAQGPVPLHLAEQAPLEQARADVSDDGSSASPGLEFSGFRLDAYLARRTCHGPFVSANWRATLQMPTARGSSADRPDCPRRRPRRRGARSSPRAAGVRRAVSSCWTSGPTAIRTWSTAVKPDQGFHPGGGRLRSVSTSSG